MYDPFAMRLEPNQKHREHQVQRVGLNNHGDYLFAEFGQTREHAKRPEDKRVLLELAELFLSNWGLDRNAEKGSEGDQSEIVFDDKGGIYFDKDGVIIEDFSDDGMDDVIDGHGWETRGRGDWGEQAVLWFDRAVRK